ncbi:unnamed protein product, partial [Amoebophrya sp. A25]|eukprot:GSA25T00021920001.1
MQKDLADFFSAIGADPSKALVEGAGSSGSKKRSSLATHEHGVVILEEMQQEHFSSSKDAPAEGEGSTSKRRKGADKADGDDGSLSPSASSRRSSSDSDSSGRASDSENAERDRLVRTRERLNREQEKLDYDWDELREDERAFAERLKAKRGGSRFVTYKEKITNEKSDKNKTTSSSSASPGKNSGKTTGGGSIFRKEPELICPPVPGTQLPVPGQTQVSTSTTSRPPQAASSGPPPVVAAAPASSTGASASRFANKVPPPTIKKTEERKAYAAAYEEYMKKNATKLGVDKVASASSVQKPALASPSGGSLYNNFVAPKTTPSTTAA